MKLFSYAILFHPTEKQKKDSGMKSIILVEPKTILQTDEKKVAMCAAMEIPAKYKDSLEQVEIVVTPF